MKYKRIFSMVVLVSYLVLLITLLSACSSDKEIFIPKPIDDVYVYDEDNAISEDVEASVNNMLNELEEKTTIEFVVISVSSLQGVDIEHYSNKVFNTLGIGKEDKDNGILLLFSRSDERVRIEIGRGLEGVLTDGKCGRILDDYFVTYRDEDMYSEATNYTVTAVLNVLADEYGFNIENLLNINVEDEKSEALKILLIIIIVIIILLLEVVFGNGSSGRSGYRGGFGGGSSSSGFGGGFSGGGGASR